MRRIASEQLAGARAELDDSSLDCEAKVHQIRKRLKRVRGVLRLVRPRFKGKYKRENVFFRDAGRVLAPYRDADVTLATLDKLRNGDAADCRALARLRQAAAAASGREGVDDALVRVRDLLEEGERRVDDWSLRGSGFGVIGDGLTAVYEKGRKASRKARRKGGADAHHEWRKRVKDHRYHMELLGEAWPAVFGARETEAKRLEDRLGDDHDVAVVRERLSRDLAGALGPRERSRVLVLLEKRSAKLRRSAERLGRKLYCEEPQELSRRIRRIWQAARG